MIAIENRLTAHFPPVITQHHIDRRDHQQGQRRRRGETEDQRDRQPLKDRIGQDEGAADHRRQGGQQDRFEADGAGVEQHITQGVAGTLPIANEIDQQDRVTHDDAGERDETDHRRRAERGIEQPVAEHDTDQGQRHRRQNHQRQFETAELAVKLCWERRLVDLGRQIQKHIELYKQNKAYRE